MAVDRSDPNLDATQRIADSDLGATYVAGQSVFSRFVLEVEIGRGGMGVVWRARDEVLGEPVALKFLPATVARDAVAIDELKDETRRARRLTHANIVRIHDFVQDAGSGTAAIAMELVEGTTLAQVRLQQPGKVFSAEELAPLVAQICAALGYAHMQAKVAHRDLKPANILVTADGTAKIADFGIARSLSETHTRLTNQTTGTSGTLLYMSPQQMRGQRAAPADDIYALGAMLYELLTTKPPFYTGEITHQILHEIPERLSERRAALAPEAPPVPHAWEETILACLAKDAVQRPVSVAEVARRLMEEKAQDTADGGQKTENGRRDVEASKCVEVAGPERGTSSRRAPAGASPDAGQNQSPPIKNAAVWIVVGVLILTVMIVLASYQLGRPQEQKKVPPVTGVTAMQPPAPTPASEYGTIMIYDNRIVEIEAPAGMSIRFVPVGAKALAYDYFVDGRLQQHYGVVGDGSHGPVANIHSKHRDGFRLAPGQGVRENLLAYVLYTDQGKDPEVREWYPLALNAGRKDL